MPHHSPPHDRTAELAVLGSAMLEAGVIGSLEAVGLKPEHFYVAAHGAAYAAMQRLYQRGAVHTDGPTDWPLVRAELRAAGHAALAARDDLLFECMKHPPSLTNALHYAAVIMQLWRRREQITAHQRAVIAITARDDDRLAEAEARLRELADAQTTDCRCEDASEYIGSRLQPRPPDLIEGIVLAGAKALLVGPSKTYKTYLSMQLAVSVATGRDWLGFGVRRGRVAFVNPELHPQSFYRRLDAVCRALGADLEPGTFTALHTRGSGLTLADVVGKLTTEAGRRGGLDFVCIDSLYKFNLGGDENAAGDMARLLSELDRLATRTGATVLFTHHTPKGNMVERHTIDRASGSGVLARDPDALLFLSRHEEDDAFVLEPVLRDHPPIEPFAIRLDYPLFSRADDLCPSAIRKPGRAIPVNTDDVERALLGSPPLTRAALIEKLVRLTGRGEKACRDAVDRAAATGSIIRTEQPRSGVRPAVLYTTAQVEEVG